MNKNEIACVAESAGKVLYAMTWPVEIAGLAAIAAILWMALP